MNRLACTLLFVSILFLLIAGGGLFPWTVALAAAVLFLAELVLSHTQQSATAPRYRGLEYAYLGILGFFCLNLLPLPTPVTFLTGNPRYEQNRQVQHATREAVDLKLLRHPVHTFALTRNRAGTLRAFALCLAVFAALFLATRVGNKQRYIFLYALTVLGGALACAGYVALRIHPQGDTLWWVFPIQHGLPGPLLCFVNRNHFAGYLALLCPIALTLFFDGMARRWFSRALVPLASFVAMTMAVALTLSRGAVVAYAGGHAVLLVLYVVRRRWKPALAVFCAATAVAAALLFLSGDSFKTRMASLREPLARGNFDERMDAWKTCGAIWRSYPVVGAGANAFRMVFPQHRTSSRREFMLHAENEFAQLAAEGGTVGILLFLAFAAAVIHHRAGHRNTTPNEPVHKLDVPPEDRQEPEPHPPDLMDAALWATVAVAALHACFDFAPRLPVYALTMATLLGLLLRAPDPQPPPRHLLLTRYLPSGWPARAGLLFVILLSIQVHAMRTMDSPARMKSMTRDRLAQSVQWAPSSWQAWFYFGRACCMQTEPDQKAFGERCITRAAELDPNNYLLWRELGHLRHTLGMTDGAREAYARAKKLRYWLDVPDL